MRLRKRPRQPRRLFVPRGRAVPPRQRLCVLRPPIAGAAAARDASRGNRRDQRRRRRRANHCARGRPGAPDPRAASALGRLLFLWAVHRPLFTPPHLRNAPRTFSQTIGITVVCLVAVAVFVQKRRRTATAEIALVHEEDIEARQSLGCPLSDAHHDIRLFRAPCVVSTSGECCAGCQLGAAPPHDSQVGHERLGRGSCAVVFAASWKGTPVAVKARDRCLRRLRRVCCSAVEARFKTRWGKQQ